MIKRGRIFLLVILISLGMTNFSVAGDSPYVISLLWNGTSHTVQSGDTIQLTHDVFTGERGLTRAWTKTIVHDIRLNGDSLFGSNRESRNYFGPITDFGAHPACPWTKTTWLTRWNYDLDNLAPGNYTLTTVLSLRHPLTDLCDILDGDGKPDIYRDEVIASTIYIHVE
jgi:hypothetical protein